MSRTTKFRLPRKEKKGYKSFLSRLPLRTVQEIETARAFREFFLNGFVPRGVFHIHSVGGP